MSGLVAERIAVNATRPGLTHLAAEAAGLAERAEAGEQGYLEFLDFALEEEVGSGRDGGSATRSSCPDCRTTRPWTSSTSPSNPSSIRAPSAGWPGSGSSPARPTAPCSDHPASEKHISVALVVGACQAGDSVYFTSVDDLVRQTREGEATGRFARKLQTHLKPAILVLDEVGHLPLSRAEVNMVLQLVARRYERGSIIVTSNKAFSDWGSAFGDGVLATAVLYQLLHHCDVVSINGPSCQLKDRLLTPPGQHRPGRSRLVTTRSSVARRQPHHTSLPVCGTGFVPTRRQAYCTNARRQIACCRRRHQPLAEPPLIPAARSRRDQTIYRCGG